MLRWIIIIKFLLEVMCPDAELKLIGNDYLKGIKINDNDYTSQYNTSFNLAIQKGNVSVKPGDTFILTISNEVTFLGFGSWFDFLKQIQYPLSTENEDLIPLWTNNKNNEILIKVNKKINGSTVDIFEFPKQMNNEITFTSIIPFAGNCTNYSISCNIETICKIYIKELFSPLLEYDGWEKKFPFKSSIDENGNLTREDKSDSITYTQTKHQDKITVEYSTYNTSMKIQTCSFDIVYCYKTCLTCNDSKNDKKHNCLTCKSNYELNDSNCECPINTIYNETLQKCIIDCDGSGNSPCYKYENKLYSKEVLMNKLNITNEFDWNMDLSNIKDIIDNESDIPRFLFDLNNSLEGKDNYEITFPNSTSSSKEIYMTKCELVLKKHYSLANEEKLKIFMIDEIDNGIMKTTYYVYDSNYNRLDISLCDQCNIIISDIIPSDTDIRFDEAEDLASKGINVFDSEDPFFNKYCYPYSNNDNLDMVLSDRRKDLYQNISLCQPGCKLSSINSKTKRYNCTCVFSEIFNPTPQKPSAFLDAIPMTNIIIAICYEHFFCNHQLISNIGFWVILSMIIIYFICFLRFIISGFYWIGKKLHKTIKKFDKHNEMVNTLPIALPPVPIQSKKKKKIVSIQSRRSNQSNNGLEFRIIANKINNSKVALNNNNNNHIKKQSIDNDIPFTKALREDKRSIIIIFWCILKHSYLFFQPFFSETPYDIICIKLAILILNMALQLTINTLFYQDNIISEKYEAGGQLILLSSILKSLYSFILNAIFIQLLISLTNYQKRLAEVTKEGQNEFQYLELVKKSMKIIKVKIVIFFISGLLLMLFSIYYITIFCTIYKGSQLSLIIDEGMSLAITTCITFTGAIICAVLRTCALKQNIRNFYYTSLYLVRYI